MKKSTMIVIFAIYMLSIVVISFLGIRVRVYDEVKYVKEIKISVEAESKDWFIFEDLGKDSFKANEYSLTINFDNARESTFQEEKNGVVIDVIKKAIQVSLIPHITYDSGDVANAEEEKIEFVLGDKTLIENGKMNLNKAGTIYAFKRGVSTPIYIKPVKSGRLSAAATVYLYVS